MEQAINHKKKTPYPFQEVLLNVWTINIFLKNSY
jgi:hypothetical protein